MAVCKYRNQIRMTQHNVFKLIFNHQNFMSFRSARANLKNQDRRQKTPLKSSSVILHAAEQGLKSGQGNFLSLDNGPANWPAVFSSTLCLGFRTCSYFHQYRDADSFLSCIKEIYVTFLQSCTQYSCFSVFGLLSFLSSSFLLFIPIYLLITKYFLLDVTSADIQGFKINNLCQKNYLLQLHL